jgi:hypothetical protein
MNDRASYEQVDEHEERAAKDRFELRNGSSVFPSALETEGTDHETQYRCIKSHATILSSITVSSA